LKVVDGGFKHHFSEL